LDVLVTKLESKFETSVFRKKIITGLYIKVGSCLSYL